MVSSEISSEATQEVDILIVGSGAAGLTAAVVAAHLGLSTILVEKTGKIGGTTSYSGGTIWVPNNAISRNAGIDDSVDLARRYVDKSLDQAGPAGPESSAARRDSYLREGPEMVDLLVHLGFRWSKKPSKFPDYHPEVEGALGTGGRTLDPAAFDASKLGPWNQHLRRPGHSAPAQYFDEFRILTKPYASILDFLSIYWMAIKARFLALVMGSPVYMGCSLAAQLLAIYLRTKQPESEIHLEARLRDLVVEEGKIRGGTIQVVDGCVVSVRARYGAILAAGGFARNQELRDRYLPHTQTNWTLALPDGELGDALQAGQAAGAATSLMGEAWWIPTMIDPVTAQTVSALFELAKPHSIVVDKEGNRFFSEAEPYGDGGRSLYGHSTGADSPAWLILDTNHRKRYSVGTLAPRSEPPVDALKTGRIFKANTVGELAGQIGVSAVGLTDTIQQWNKTCGNGVDADFARGQDEYQLFIGDSSAKHPSLGPIAKPPFYAIRVLPGDAGTKGGLLTDESARVVREDGSPIQGLYAAGNSSASVVGATSLGAGVTLGPAMTFAYLAVHDIHERKKQGLEAQV